MNATKELNQMIDGAAKVGINALKATQWRFRGPNGEFVGLNGLKCAFVPESEASIFDGRDNPDMKLKFWEIMLKTSLAIEILPQSK